MTWHQSDGVRWSGWTLLFAALLTLALSMLAHNLPEWLGALALLAALATFVLPLLVGILFPEDNWWFGPCLGMVIALVLLLIIPATDPPVQTGIGLVTRKDQFIFLLIWGGWLLLSVLLLIYVGLAFLGIWIGGRRLDTLATQNWDSDAEFRNMFATDRTVGPEER